MIDFLVWKQPDTTATGNCLVVLRWCPLAYDFVEVSRCIKCPYVVDTTGECKYDC